jgi:serine/threonine-protein kinase
MASGGTATVHLGRLSGTAGFARVVCIKRLHPHLAKEAEFVKMLLDEARIAARIRHPNVVSILDVVSDEAEVFVVMEYVAGQPLARLVRLAGERGERVPVPVAVAIVRDLLQGLHAAHETCDENGEPLGVVHRDVSPQNVLVGQDGIARVVDFGIAKARGRLSTTEEGRLKGKLAYMAPEQLRADEVTRKSDVYAAGIVLWELLCGERLFAGDNEGHILEQALLADIAPPSGHAADLPKGLDDVVLRALERDPAQRYATARDMVAALDTCVLPAPASEVAAWVSAIAGNDLSLQAARVLEVEKAAMPVEAIRRWRGWKAAGGVALAVLVGVGIGAFASSRTSSKAEAAAPVPPPASEQAPPEPSTQPAVAAPPASSQATAPEGLRRHPAPKPRRLVARPSGAAPTPTRVDSCNPPFTRDADGVKVWKPECVLK